MFGTTLSASELARRTWKEFGEDDVVGLSAQLSYYFFLALFPAILFVLSFASFFPLSNLTDEIGRSLGTIVSPQVVTLIQDQMRRLANKEDGGLLTLGAVLALYFSSSGVESLRVGLNRAYGLREMRPWWLTRLESIGYVICAAFAMLAFTFLVVLGPLVWRGLVLVAPGLEPLGLTVAVGRVGVTVLLVSAVLVIAHKFIAAGRRPVVLVLPGIAVTLCLWVLAGLGFGMYLDRFSSAYVSTYGGLATAMVFLVFVYWLAAMFLFGGEINGTVIAARRRRLQAQAQRRRDTVKLL